MNRTVQSEFPNFVLNVTIPAGFVDMSWKNEITASWERRTFDGRAVKLWIYDANPEQRDIDAGEFPAGHHFALSVVDKEDDLIADVFDTQNFSEITAYCAELDRIEAIVMAFNSIKKEAPNAPCSATVSQLDPSSGTAQTGGGCTAIVSEYCYATANMPYYMICEEGGSNVADTVGESWTGMYLYEGDDGEMV